MMSLALHGQQNKAAWEVTDIKDFIQELATLKYFEEGDRIESTFVDTGRMRGTLANLTRIFGALAHQLLLHVDATYFQRIALRRG